MDFLTAVVIIVAITGATVVFVVKILSSTPARIAAVLGAVAVLFGVIPHIIAPLSSTPTAPTPSATVTVVPMPQAPAPGVSPPATRPPASTVGGVL